MTIPAQHVCVPLTGSFPAINHSWTLLISCYIFSAKIWVKNPFAAFASDSFVCFSLIHQNVFRKNTILQGCKIKSLEENLWALNNFHVTANDKYEVWPNKDVVDVSAPLTAFNNVIKDRNYRQKLPFLLLNKTRFTPRTILPFISAQKNKETLSWVRFFVCFFFFQFRFNMLRIKVLKKKKKLVPSLMNFYLQPHKHIALALAANFFWHCMKSLSHLLALGRRQYVL